MLPPRISSPASLQHILHEGWKSDNVLPLLESPQSLPLHTESNPSPLLWPIGALAWLSPGQLHTRCKDLISVPQTSNVHSQTQAITIAVPTQQLHFHFHFHALEKEMATHSSVLAWRIPGTGEPGGLPSVGSQRVGQDCSDLAAATI